MVHVSARIVPFSQSLSHIIITRPTFTNTFQDVKEQNLCLKSELDLLKMEKDNGFHGSKGNSLFGEVEDKRMDAERKLISLQVRHESLEKTHSTTKQRYARLKVRKLNKQTVYGTYSGYISRV